MKDNMKENIKAKGASVKAKLKGMKDKAKGAKKCAALVAAFGIAALVCGCMDTNPASRQNSNRFGDIEPTVKVVIGENASSNTVAVTVKTTLGDGVLASADSAGSTETQTATPTQTTDVKPDVDVNYNDAAKTAADALGNAASGANKIKDTAAKVAELITEPAKTETAEPAVETAAPSAGSAAPSAEGVN